jgi:hypothetical protein
MFVSVHPAEVVMSLSVLSAEEVSAIPKKLEPAMDTSERGAKARRRARVYAMAMA